MSSGISPVLAAPGVAAASAAATPVTIDIDTGGTFTDAYVAGPHGAFQVKADTTPHDLRAGILDCLDLAAAALGMSRPALLATAGTVRLSTTVGTNALIAGTGARVGLLLSERLYGELAATLPNQVPLPAELIAAVPHAAPAGDPAAGPAGQVKRLLEHGARIIVLGLDDDRGDGLAAAETALREAIAREYPRHYLGTVPVLASHQVSLTPDNAARIRTAVLNAYLHPLMARFLYRVEDELRREGYRHPLLIANADGGSSRVAKTTAIRTWGSGPAGAVAGGAHLARLFGASLLLTLDVGGTSSDIALVAPGSWNYVVQPDIAGARVAVPLLELESVGVGGGSVIRAAEGGHLTVGPDSAGAQPGPAAYGLGGEQATVTDAFCCAGAFDPDNFLGGRKRLDTEAARQAIAEVASALGISVADAAARAITVAAAEVAGSVVDLVRRRGCRPADVELLVAGGAGGMLGCYVAAAAGLAAVRAVPMTPVFSAFGLSVLDRSHTYELPASGDIAVLAGQLDAALARARADMRTEGVDPAWLRFELEIETGADGAVTARTLGTVSDGTQAAGLVAGAAEPARLVRLRAVAAGTPVPLPETGPPPAGAAEAAPPAERLVSFTGKPERAAVLPWSALVPGQRLDGPAVVESEHTTFLIPPGFTGVAGRHGDLLIHPPATTARSHP